MSQKVKEQESGGPEKCECPDCDYETDKKRGVPCRSMVCPECGAELVAQTEEQAMPFSDIGQIAKSAIEVGLAVTNGSGEITKERANKVLRRWEAELEELEKGISLANSASFNIDGESVSLTELQDAFREYQVRLTEPYPNEHACRVRDPGDFQANSFRSKTLPKSEGGKGGVRMIIGRLKGKTTTTAQTYRFPADMYTTAEAKAWLKANDVTCSKFEAATGKQSEAEPCGCEEVIRKEGDAIILYDNEGKKVLQRFPFGEGEKYKDEDSAREAAEKRERQIQFFKHQGEAMAEYEIAGSTIREVLMYLLDMWHEAKTPEEQAEAEMESSGLAVEVARDATPEDTATLSEAEAASIEAGRRAPVVIDFQVIKPGPGNKRDGHYYPADVVKRDIHVFEGAHVFTTNHKGEERSERTKVGKVLACPTRFTEEKAPIAQVLIYDPNQAEKARNRADADALDTLECSIFGKGRAKKGEVEGQEYKIVEALTEGIYLELVHEGGAGGKAVGLAESERSPEPDGSGQGGEDMKDEKKAEAAPVEEVEIEEANADEPQKLETEVVKEAVGKTNLPEFAKNALLVQEYATDDELKEAVGEAIAEVKKLTGSGQVTGLGESKVVDAKPASERDRILGFNEIMAEVGLEPVPVPDKEEAK